LTPPLTDKKKKISENNKAKESDISIGRDFFVIILGLLLTLLGFALFAIVSGMGLQIIFPRSGSSIIGYDGQPLDSSDMKFAPGVTREYFDMGLVLTAIALVVFISVFVVLCWMKKDDSSGAGKPDAP